MLRCDELTRALATGELDDAGWFRKLQARFHLLMCRHCRAYSAQLRAIGQSARDLLEHQLQDPDAERRLENEILKDAFRK